MFLIVLSLMVAAISRIRSRIEFAGFTRSGIARGDFSITGQSAEQSRITSPLKPFLIVMLPDGTIVTPMVAGQV
jgi:hypothetical protein